MKNILAADIGGTNSRFAHFTAERENLKLVEAKWLRTDEAASFAMLMENLWKSGFPLRPEEADIAVIAVAGPVEHGGVYSAPPLIPWDVDISHSPSDLGLRRAVLINDFVAQAYSCRSPAGEAAERVLPGTGVPEAAAAVLGAGTGLGKAALVPDGRGGFIAVPSEGGHANFPFVTAGEYEYQRFLLGETGDEYMTYNVVVSGRGLSLLHRFLTGEDLTPQEVTAGFSQDSETLQWAARFYGRTARNYALETLAMGGVYIAGGVAAKAPALVTHGAFAEEFRTNPKHGTLLGEIPVYLISDEQSGLWGAGFMGLLELKKGA